MNIQTPLFEGIDADDIPSMFSCLGAKTKSYQKDETIWHSGMAIHEIAVVAEGIVCIKAFDIWGKEGIIGMAGEGDLFGEAYACTGEPLRVDVVASSDCSVLFLELGKISQPCGKACVFHSRLIANLLSIMAAKNLMLNRKIKDISPRTIKERVLSYLEREAERQGSPSFAIPFSRQQLADYLCVDRSALSATLSSLEKEGIIYCNRNSFVIKGRS